MWVVKDFFFLSLYSFMLLLNNFYHLETHCKNAWDYVHPKDCHYRETGISKSVTIQLVVDKLFPVAVPGFVYIWA